MTQSSVFPSQSRPWLQYYAKDAFRIATEIPQGLTIWQFLEKKLRELGDGTAIEYFGRRISREEFIRQVDRWARVFHNLGVREDEVVCLFGPTLPEFCYMAFALNTLGAVPYFLKLSMSQKSLQEEAAGSHIAVVFDGMWEQTRETFCREQFAKVLFVSASDSMPSPLREIVSFQNRKVRRTLPRGSKYLRVKQALEQYGQGALPSVAYHPGRTAFITSSSGTTSTGLVKGIMTQNEAAIAQVLQATAAGFTFSPDDRILNNLPLTVASSLNFLLIWALYLGVTVVMDPRLSEKEVYSQILRSKCTLASLTGACWETVFHQVEEQIHAGKKPDLSRLRMAVMGGEGTTPEKLAWMDSLLRQCGGGKILSGYGLSKAFSTIAYPLGADEEDKQYEVICVGRPYPGVVAGVFDENGNELPCGQRGELWLQSPTLMQGYYQKEDLTRRTLYDGWLHTGDLFSISESGRLYCYGRLCDHVDIDGHRVYLIDLASALRKSALIRDVLVDTLPLADGQTAIMAHILLTREQQTPEKQTVTGILKELNQLAAPLLPPDHSITGFKIQHGQFRNSATTMKIDRNSYKKELEGYLQVIDGALLSISMQGNPDIGYEVLRSPYSPI